MGQIRAFLAVELPENVLRRLAQVQQRLRQALPNLAYVRPEGLHITLKFLGEISEEQVAAVSRSVRATASRFSRFRLHIEGLGTFPPQGQPRVVWLGVAGDVPILSALAVQVEQDLKRLGLRQEDRPFSPHLTLARVRQRLSAGELTQLRLLGQQLAGKIGREFEIVEISLMRSHLRSGGAVYERLEAYPLGGAVG